MVEIRNGLSNYGPPEAGIEMIDFRFEDYLSRVSDLSPVIYLLSWRRCLLNWVMDGL